MHCCTFRRWAAVDAVVFLFVAAQSRALPRAPGCVQLQLQCSRAAKLQCSSAVHCSAATCTWLRSDAAAVLRGKKSKLQSERARTWGQKAFCIARRNSSWQRRDVFWMMLHCTHKPFLCIFKRPPSISIPKRKTATTFLSKKINWNSSRGLLLFFLVLKWGGRGLVKKSPCV